MERTIKRNHAEQLAQLLEMVNGTLQCWTPNVTYVTGTDGFTYVLHGPGAAYWHRNNEKMLATGPDAMRLPATNAYAAK